LIEALSSNYLSKQSLTESEEKAEYARQRKVLGDGPSAVQYQLRQVLLDTAQEARDVIAHAKKERVFRSWLLKSWTPAIRPMVVSLAACSHRSCCPQVIRWTLPCQNALWPQSLFKRLQARRR